MKICIAVNWQLFDQGLQGNVRKGVVTTAHICQQCHQQGGGKQFEAGIDIYGHTKCLILYTGVCKEHKTILLY